MCVFPNPGPVFLVLYPGDPHHNGWVILKEGFGAAYSLNCKYFVQDIDFIGVITFRCSKCAKIFITGYFLGINFIGNLLGRC